jgi:hypothetical protein
MRIYKNPNGKEEGEKRKIENSFFSLFSFLLFFSSSSTSSSKQQTEENKEENNRRDVKRTQNKKPRFKLQTGLGLHYCYCWFLRSEFSSNVYLSVGDN